MTNQLFKKNVPKDVLFDFLKTICDSKTDSNYKCYIVSNTSFKKAKYYNLLDEFCLKIKDCYHISKQNILVKK